MSGGINLKHRPIIGNRALGYRAVQVLDFVRQAVEANGRSPSYGMIRDQLGFSHECDVHRVVVRLERRGLLMRVGSARVRRGLDWNQPVIRLAS